MPADDAIEVTARVAGILESCGIPYFVVGSLASSAHGIPRSTQDIDIVADLRRCDIGCLAGAFAADFYLDPDRIVDAIRRGGSFNIIHLATMFKVDIFMLQGEAPFVEEMNRRVSIAFRDDPGSRLWVASAEDTVVQKLRLDENSSPSVHIEVHVQASVQVQDHGMQRYGFAIGAG
jgi:hypothetical protein